ncbi:NAD(P)H-hydrate dehydratase [Flavobacterium piscinae]|uniref:Bifunctional NAD(P)H-hydrate repair enzyme n=1 Tax=Flavobacterium piscinae TaxID=2506424 RepID=A0A4Q1KPP7_9FLAO|nr:NAD(P)H-hydrate dehydratase [Flavobacterium piscinae]RXR31229.1 NAD(P)H-hydrate dehydratase [Flavobacterium piscinae]
MKIFTAEKIKELDKLTIERQQISSLELMERAALQAFLWLVNHFQDKKTVYHIFCGVGNNGGDGLVIARMLKQNYFEVHVYVVSFSENFSVDFNSNLGRLKECNLSYDVISETSEFPDIGENHIIVDAIFGIGLTRELASWIQKLIQKINYHQSFKVSIDVPSGLFLDKKTTIAIHSDVVLTFEFPKLAFYLPENENYIDNIVLLPIQLDEKSIESIPTNYYYTDLNEIKRRYKPISKFSHKGTQGHVLLIGGCFGKIGAMVLASQAALRSGCGLATVFIPKCGYEIMQTATPEAMVIADENNYKITDINFAIQPKAIGIGMGIGQENETKEAFYHFLKNNLTPLVVDADALNILSEHPEWLELVPKNSILTPHPRELERLIGTWKDDFEKIEKTRQLAQKYQFVILIKGAYTLIIEGKNVYVNSSGNQALATGGSGDVLSGMITSFRAQGYSAVDAAFLGVYFHGRTADIAMNDMGYEGFIASDIIKYLGKVFLELKN